MRNNQRKTKKAPSPRARSRTRYESVNHRTIKARPYRKAWRLARFRNIYYPQPAPPPSCGCTLRMLTVHCANDGALRPGIRLVCPFVSVSTNDLLLCRVFLSFCFVIVIKVGECWGASWMVVDGLQWSSWKDWLECANEVFKRGSMQIVRRALLFTQQLQLNQCVAAPTMVRLKMYWHQHSGWGKRLN